MLMRPALTSTDPALPWSNVLEEMTPLPRMASAPVADTLTLPALPLPALAWLTMPVVASEARPSTTMSRADTLTVPALPDAKVLEEIWPPFRTDSRPEDVTLTLPARPRAYALLAIDVTVSVNVPPSMRMLPARTSTEPAAPVEKLFEATVAPLMSARAPAEVMQTA